MMKNPLQYLRQQYETLASEHKREFAVLRRAARHFQQVNVPQAAASMAYYALFSLFPLLLLLISLTSVVLKNDAVQQQIFRYLNEAIPVSQEFVQQNIQQVLSSRGPVSIIGIATLFWSASGFFSAMVTSINAAWPQTEQRGFLGRRMLAFGMVVGLASLLLASLTARTILHLLPIVSRHLSLDIQAFQSTTWKASVVILPSLLHFLVFLTLYRLVPTTRVSWRAAIGGASAAFLMWESITYVFSWYVTSGIAKYQLVYGSVGRLVALLFWIYLGSLSLILGAHLCATIDALHKTRRTTA
jgi:membrane protein